MQRERALRERLQMDRNHAKAATKEEPPKLVNRSLDKDADSDNEDNDAAATFEVVPTTAPPGPSANVPVVSQDEDVADTPAANIRARSKLRILQNKAHANLEAIVVLA